MKLTTAQQSAVDLLNDGWEIGQSLAFDGGAWIQKGGAGKGGESKRLNLSTLVSLREKGVIVCVERKFPFARYRLK